MHQLATLTQPEPSTLPLDNYITGLEGGQRGLMSLIDLAMDIKHNALAYQKARPLEGKVFAALFLNPSLRTRTSFESGLAQLGGHMLTLSPGAGAWNLEFEKGKVMSGDSAEHIVEAAGVLSSYADCIGLRAFAPMQDFAEEMCDEPIQQLAKHASVPVVSLESSCYHPCQALADAMTLMELFNGEPAKKRFTLTWATHPKMCGVAVPHSALLTAARLGMKVTVAHPPGYALHDAVLSQAATFAQQTGGSLEITDNMTSACRETNVIYAKAWGSPLDYGNVAAGIERNASYGDWTVGTEHLSAGKNPSFMHCLPIRRNVVASDQVLDSSNSVVLQQAENRMWAQMALLFQLLTAS